MKGYVTAGVVLLITVFFIGSYWAFLGRVELVRAQRQTCHADVNDRRSDILVRATQAWAAQRVADDEQQPRYTRQARRIEAAEDRASVRDRLTRVDNHAVASLLADASKEVRALIVRLDTGTRLDCNREHPNARLLP